MLSLLFGVLLVFALRLMNGQMPFSATRHARHAMSQHELPELSDCELLT
jgi:hypothetical protein